MQLKSTAKYEGSIGTVFAFDGEVTVRDIEPYLGKEVLIDGELYKIRGIETFQKAEPFRGDMKRFGLLVEKVVLRGKVVVRLIEDIPVHELQRGSFPITVNALGIPIGSTLFVDDDKLIVQKYLGDTSTGYKYWVQSPTHVWPYLHSRQGTRFDIKLSDNASEIEKLFWYGNETT